MKHVLRLIRTQLRQHVGGIALRLVLAVIVSSGPYIFSFLGKWLVDEVIQIQKKPPVEASASAAKIAKSTPSQGMFAPRDR